MPDAQVLLEFWRRLRAEWPADVLQQALDAAQLRATLPAALSPDLADDLPESSGRLSILRSGRAGRRHSSIYRQGEQPARARAGSLPGAVPTTPSRCGSRRRCGASTGPQTAGELGALLLEAREIRESQPVYNRQLRGNGERFTWLFGDSAKRRRTGRAGCRGGARRECLRDLARAARCAACAREPGTRTPLVLQVVRPGEGPGSCFGLQVGRCAGACIGQGSRRLAPGAREMGLMPLRLAPWPHAGPVVVREGSGECEHLHLIDGWQHLATVRGRRMRRSARRTGAFRDHPAPALRNRRVPHPHAHAARYTAAHLRPIAATECAESGFAAFVGQHCETVDDGHVARCRGHPAFGAHAVRAWARRWAS